MQFYTSRSGPKLALVCEPGANPSNIKLAFEGQDSLKIDIYGTLKMYVKGKWFALNQAVAYQMDSQGNMTSLPWVPTYNENNGLGFVNFNFGNYNAERPLVLQIGLPNFPAWEVPEPRNMQWCTYAGSDNSDEFMATDVDASGDVYATGYSYQANFPVGTGYQVFPPNTSEFIGSEDVVTMKFSHDSKQIQWATYHGGSAVPQNLSDEWRGMDKAYDLVAYNGPISELQYVFVTGTTASVDFPTIARSQTPFANADEISFAAGLNGDEHAAFVLAYTESNGRLDWSTTLGTTPGQIWVADGLGVDIDEAGTLIWAGRVSRTSPGGPGTFPYPYVTPTGAFTRPDGGGFFVLFDSDYQIIWNTFFGSAGAEGGVHDVKIARIGEERKAFLTGVTSVPSPPSVVGLDVYQPPGSIGFFQAQHGGGMRDGYLAVLNLENYQLDFSTYWGGNGRDFGIALEVVTLLPHGDKQVWVGGVSKSTDLGNVELPPSPFGGMHQTTNAGDADGFILAFNTVPEMDLAYGTLYGGAGSDAVLDIAAGVSGSSSFNAAQVYFTGETSSATGMLPVQNDNLYEQSLLGNAVGGLKRDGFILSLNPYSKDPIWSTYIGGLNTDKCWGVAAATNELFVVGGTSSNQTTFPLKEFNVSTPQDWYDGNLLNNSSSGANGSYSFNEKSFYRPFDAELLQSEYSAGDLTFDAFIASFGVTPTLSIDEDRVDHSGLSPVLQDQEGLWSLKIPTGMRQVRLFDATGRMIDERSVALQEHVEWVDLRSLAKGVYLVACSSTNGDVLSAKLFRP